MDTTMDACPSSASSSSSSEDDDDGHHQYYTPRGMHESPWVSVGGERKVAGTGGGDGGAGLKKHASVAKLELLLSSSSRQLLPLAPNLSSRLARTKELRASHNKYHSRGSSLSLRTTSSRGSPSAATAATAATNAATSNAATDAGMLSSWQRSSDLNMAAKLVYDVLKLKKTDASITLKRLEAFATSWLTTSAEHARGGPNADESSGGKDSVLQPPSASAPVPAAGTSTIELSKAERAAVQQFVAFLSNVKSIPAMFHHKKAITEDEFIPIANRAFIAYQRNQLQRLFDFMTSEDVPDGFAAAMFHIDRLISRGFYLHDILSYGHEMCSRSNNAGETEEQKGNGAAFSPAQVRALWRGVLNMLQIPHFRIRIFSDTSSTEALKTMALNPPSDAHAQDVLDVWNYVFPTENISDHVGNSEVLAVLAAAEMDPETKSKKQKEQDEPTATSPSLPANFRDMSLRLRFLDFAEWRAPELATEIARQYTMYQIRLYRQIKPWEFLHAKRHERAGLAHYAKDFDQTVWYMKDAILATDSVIDRARVIKALIEIAHASVQPALSNFNLTMQCFLALNSGEIRGLAESWKHIKAGKNDRLRKWKLLKSFCKNNGAKLASLQRSTALGEANKSTFAKLKFWGASSDGKAGTPTESRWKRRCVPFLPPILQALMLTEEDASIRKTCAAKSNVTNTDPINTLLMRKRFSIVSPYYDILMSDKHPYPELQYVTVIQQAISCSARLSDRAYQSFVRNRAHRLSKSQEKLAPSHPNYSTQRFIMLENKSPERRIALYVEFALNEVASHVALSGDAPDNRTQNPGFASSASSTASAYLDHLFLGSGSEASAGNVSEVTAYAQRCLAVCRDLYRRNGASPLLLFNIKKSAELIYGYLFDQTSQHSRYEDLRGLWGRHSRSHHSRSSSGSVDSSGGGQELRSMNIHIRAGIDIVHPKTRHASQGHGMLVRMYPSWGFGTLAAQTRPHRSGTSSERNPVWHVHRHNALQHFPIPLGDVSKDGLYVDIELYSRTNKRGSEKETLLGSTRLYLASVMGAAAAAATAAAVSAEQQQQQVTSDFVVPASSESSDPRGETHSLTMKLRQHDNDVGQLVMDSWISVLPSCPAPKSELGVQVYNATVRALLAPINGQIEQCIDEAKSGSRKIVAYFRHSVLSDIMLSAAKFRVRRQIVTKGSEHGLDKATLARLAREIDAQTHGVSTRNKNEPTSIYLENLAVVRSLCAQFSEGRLTQMDPQFNHVISDFVTRKQLVFRYY